MSAVHLPKSLAAWGGEAFKETLTRELAGLDPACYPLQQGLSQSSIALDHDLSFVLISADESEQALRARVGIFFKGMIAGCSCADDPSPADEQPEYCEVWVRIDPDSAETTIRLAE